MGYVAEKNGWDWIGISVVTWHCSLLCIFERWVKSKGIVKCNSMCISYKFLIKLPMSFYAYEIMLYFFIR